MIFAQPHWSDIHRKTGFNFWTPLLGISSFLYGTGVRVRLAAYKYDLFKDKTLPGFVVSIGNLVAGGTGKTPAAVMLARWAQRAGYRVAILSRGYGGRHKGDILLVSDGDRVLADSKEAGDEPCLLAGRLPAIPVVVCRKRYRAGMFAYNEFGSDFFILDDGLQHLELKRDLNLVLIDASNPFGNGHLLPLGPLREPLKQLIRADACILTRSDDAYLIQKTRNLIRKNLPDGGIFSAQHVPDRVIFPFTGEIQGPQFLKEKRIVAFAGIACPEAFRQTLTDLGAEVSHFRSFGDHHPFRREEVEEMIRMKVKLNAQCLITTEKDWVRVRSLIPSYPELGYLRISFELLPGEKDDFFGMVKDYINRKAQIAMQLGI